MRALLLASLVPSECPAALQQPAAGRLFLRRWRRWGVVVVVLAADDDRLDSMEVLEPAEEDEVAVDVRFSGRKSAEPRPVRLLPDVRGGFGPPELPLAPPPPPPPSAGGDVWRVLRIALLL